MRLRIDLSSASSSPSSSCSASSSSHPFSYPFHYPSSSSAHPHDRVSSRTLTRSSHRPLRLAAALLLLSYAEALGLYPLHRPPLSKVLTFAGNSLSAPPLSSALTMPKRYTSPCSLLVRAECSAGRSACVHMAALAPPAPSSLYSRLLRTLVLWLNRLLVWLKIAKPKLRTPFAPWRPLAQVVVGRATREFEQLHEVYTYYSYMTSPFYATLATPIPTVHSVEAGAPVKWMRSVDDVVHELDRRRDAIRFEFLVDQMLDEQEADAEVEEVVVGFRWPWEK